AQALLAAVTPRATPRWEVDPAVERRRNMEGQVQQLGGSLFNYAQQHDVVDYDAKTKRTTFKSDLLKQIQKAQFVNAQMLKDPFGRELSLDGLAKLEKNFTPDRLAQAATANHMQTTAGTFIQHTQSNKAKWFKDGKWPSPATVLADAAKAMRNDRWLKDAWGREM